MESKNTAVYGICSNLESAEQAVDHLTTAGVPSNDVSILMADIDSTRTFAHQKATKTPEGTASGATSGGVLGGTLGLLASLGALAIPGVGPLIAAGPIMATLAGLGVGGALGGLLGALAGLSIPEYEARRYEGCAKNGGVLLSVHCNTTHDIRRAKDFLRATGAEDISSASEVPVYSRVRASDTEAATRS